MSPNLVRVFTCSSVLALGGAAAASSMLACGGDDPPADDGASSSSSGSSGKTSSSSSSSGGSSSSSGGTATCDPAGTYDFPANVYEGKEGVCTKLAQELNGGAGYAYTYAKKSNGFYSETAADGSEAEMKIDAESAPACALTAFRGNAGDAKDLDGKDVKFAIDGQVKVIFKESEALYVGASEVTSETAGAKGFPCTITYKSTGKKK